MWYSLAAMKLNSAWRILSCLLLFYAKGFFQSSQAGLPKAGPGFEALPGQRIFLKGDSIANGFAFGNFTNPSPLRTVYGIATILLQDNLPHPPQFSRLTPVWEGLKADGTPETVDSLAGEIQVNVRQGDLRPGDWMIYEDAGELDKVVHPAPWPDAKNMYQRQREALRGMVLEADNSIGRDHVLMMTMFDYDPKAPWCAWDAPLDDGVHSGNDSIRDEAAALGVRVINLRRIMNRAEDYIASGGWGRVVGPDGIHPNVYGNYVMALAILGSMGADIAEWKIDGLHGHFRHPATGGDVETVWGFAKDPSDQQRITMLIRLRKMVADELKKDLRQKQKPRPVSIPEGGDFAGRTFRRLLRHGRILDHPSSQPEGTEKPCSYELGKLFQLDATNLLLIASLREQGGHDFEVGNDGFVFQNLSDIVPAKAFPVNRLEPHYKLKSGSEAVLAKFPVNGGFMPIGAKLDNGKVHPAGGTGFLLSTAAAFLPERTEMVTNHDHFLEFMQVTWDGVKVTVTKDRLPDRFGARLRNAGFDCVPQAGGFLCPCVSADGIVVLRFEYQEGRWQPAAAGKPFLTAKGETEPSLRKAGNEYLVYTRGTTDRKGRVYRSQDGLNYYLAFDHWNYTVPQALNQGLDGSLYLATCTGPGWLRNPLLAFSLRGQSFVNPIIIHDEKQIGDDTGKEVPFCDHGIASNVFLNGRWRHLLFYRVCDLRETSGKGAPPFPQTGLYLAEFEYDRTVDMPFKF